jgi:diguanylate cyclase (GGDEF)-like protein
MNPRPRDSTAVESTAPATGQISCSMPSVLINRVRGTLGHEAVDELLRMSGVDYTATYLDDPGNWIWYDEAIAMFEAAVALTGDEHIGRRVGEETVRQHAGTPVATLFRSLGSPEKVYEQLAIAVTKFSTVTELSSLEVSPGRAVVRAKARPGFKRHRHLCDWTLGMMSQPPVLFGLPPADVVESACEIRGDEHCLYTVSWDADRAARAVDPQELVTTLEAQLVAMTDRLENMYATARDLIAVDDLDAALARITERAATAVRAPKYLLAVRIGHAGTAHVHQRGFGDEDLEEVADALLEGPVDQSESRLVVEVASATRHYGRLMAASPAGEFFPSERELLDVYARYAAAVLDTATALDEARQRHDQSHALLELSRAVAAAGTSEEVAQRLVDAVPGVVDCDQVAVFLWSDEEQALSCGAVMERSPGAGEVIRGLRVRPTDTPLLARLLDDPAPDPLFFESSDSDQFVRRTMGLTGSSALIIAPIVARDRFYGILNVSVRERPERLGRTPGLVDRLAGVGAQAATALDNARLLDKMAHQARTDNLTGLLAHRAFHETLEEAITGQGSERTFALASIDIDDFKRINDLHGHPVGDEALRLVASTLRQSVRANDSVFRVGGEEFAVLLPGMAAKGALPLIERLRTAVSGIPFDPRLRVSIGLASWPVDAADRAGLLKCADAALYAAKRSGKDRTTLADAS